MGPTETSEYRFQHLLQPIRNLANNWNIDLASELEEYLEELESLTISFDEGSTNLNFAEAALLIQGTACIYSRKVEYLYALVYQALDLLAERRNKQAIQPSQPHGDANDIADDSEVFLALDDILVEGKNIDLQEDRHLPHRKLNERLLQSRSLGSKRSSMALLSALIPDDRDRGDVFKISTCSVHKSGALLLDNDFRDTLNSNLEPNSSQADRSNLIEQEAGSAMPDNTDDMSEYDAGGADASGYQSDSDMEDAHMQQEQLTGKITGTVVDGLVVGSSEGNKQYAARKANAPKPRVKLDPFAPLDPYDVGSVAPKPFKKGKTSRKPKVDSSLPEFDISKCEKYFWGSFSSAQSAKIKIREIDIGGEKAEMADFPFEGTLLPEFEAYYNAEKAWVQAQRLANSRLAAVEDPAYDDEESDDDANDAYGVGAADIGGGGDDDDDDGYDNFTSGDNIGADGAEEDTYRPISLDEAFRDAPQSYEELCRAHVEKFMRGAEEYLKETQLSKRVADWQEKLLPKLQEEKSLPEFDIHRYGDNIIESIEQKITDNQAVKSKKNKDEVVVEFKKIVEERNVREISRLFLATLQLANNGNVQLIHKEALTDPKDFRLGLLTTEKIYDLENYQAPSSQQTSQASNSSVAVS